MSVGRTPEASGRPSDEIAPRSRPDVLATALLFVLALGIWLPRLAGPLDLRYDAGVYYVLGTSLAEGRGYRLLNEPGAIEAIQYPPLLPLLVAAHQWATGTSDPAVTGQALRVTYAVLFVIYGVLVYRLARRWLPLAWALAAAALVQLHLQPLLLSDLLFAELPFAVCTTAFLLLADDGRVRAAVLAAAAFLFRSTGIAACAAWVGHAILHRQYRDAVIRAALSALPIVAWQLYVGGVQRSADYAATAYAYQRAGYQFYNVGYVENMSYLDPFAPERGLATRSQVAGRTLRNLAALPAELGASVIVHGDWLLGPVIRLNQRYLPAELPLGIRHAPFILVGITSIAGQALLAARGSFLLPLYWAGSVLLIASTPWPGQFGRYLMPLAPVTAIGLLVALTALRTRYPHALVGGAIGTLVAGALTAQLAVLGFVFAARHHPAVLTDNRLFFYDSAWRDHDAAIAWLGRHAEPNAVVVTTTPHWVHLWTGLRAVFPPFEPDPAEADRLLAAVPADYLIVDHFEFLDFTRRYAAPVVTAFPERWTLVYGDPAAGSRIYRRAGSPSAP